jgi:phospholipase D1/2
MSPPPGPPDVSHPSGDRILVPGESCWRRSMAERLAFLVDAGAYFPALASALTKARRQILIIAWDFYSRLKLIGPGDDPEAHPDIKTLLEGLLEAHPDLEVHLVLWDPAVIYRFQREPFPTFKLGRHTHPRFHFHLDENFPSGVSQHQKVVVIDDAVAFAGGLDLTVRRWDTPEHRPRHPHRLENGRNEYRPFHDIQVAVAGDAARDLGDLARERIRLAGGVRLDPPHSEGRRWPEGLVPDLERVAVGIARTQTRWGPVETRRDTLEIYARAIGRARRHVYIENQHLTSYRVTEMLCRRLREPGGPEIVIVLPRLAGGWLEHGGMGTQRARMCRLLSAADRHGRLRIYDPYVAGLDPKLWIHVHSKLLIVDDALVMIGSSNLTNRSLALDTEMDIAVESEGDARIGAAVRDLRNRLLAEHLGTRPEQMAEAALERGSLIGGIEALSGGPRTLEPLDPAVPPFYEEFLTEEDLLDPEEPVAPKDMMAQLAAVEDGRIRSRPMLRTGLLLLLAAALGLVWRYTPVQQYLEPELLVAWTQPIRESALAPVISIGAFLVGGLVAFPVLVLILATGIAFGPVYGLIYALVGCMLASALGYAVGSKVGKGGLRRVAGSKVDRISRALAERGILAVAAIRLVPLAPFTVVNMAAGASHIRLRDYLVGTFIGMAPGIVAITVFGHGIARAIGAGQIGWLVAILMVPTLLLLLGSWVRKFRAKRRGRIPHRAAPEPQGARP